MPTTLQLEYSHSLEIIVPNAIAAKLKKGAKDGEAWSYYVKWGTLYYLDADLKEHEIESEANEVDYKRDIGQQWQDEEESEEEETDEEMKARGAMDGDGFVIADKEAEAALPDGFNCSAGFHCKPCDAIWVNSTKCVTCE